MFRRNKSNFFVACLNVKKDPFVKNLKIYKLMLLCEVLCGWQLSFGCIFSALTTIVKSNDLRWKNIIVYVSISSINYGLSFIMSKIYTMYLLLMIRKFQQIEDFLFLSLVQYYRWRAGKIFPMYGTNAYWSVKSFRIATTAATRDLFL